MTSTSPEPAATLTTLKVGIVSKTFFYVPLWAAIDKGWFKAAGLDVQTTLLGAGSQTPPLLSGEMHVALATPEAALQDAATGGPLRIVAGQTGKLTHSLISRPPFKTVESLRGATIGILNRVEGTFFQLKTMMAQHGLHYPGDYEVTETGGVPPRHKALLEGSIDAGLQSIPWSFVAEEAGLNTLGEVNRYVPDWQFVSINANLDWARSHGAELTAFLTVLLRATEWLYGHRAEAAAIAEAALPSSRDHAERAWDHYTQTNALTRDMAVNRRGLEVVIETQLEAGLLPAGAPTDPDFYIDTTWLDAARRAVQNDAKEL